MALAVNLYNFSKRENSTKVPETVGESFSCVLRGACGVVAPSLQLTIANPTQYNYAYIPDFGRYYFIREWKYADRLWQCDLEVDVLASYKTLIGASTQYVTRAAYEWDGNIIDNLYPTTTEINLVTTNASNNPFQNVLPNGFYVVGVVNGDETGHGGVCYYMLSEIELNALKSYLFQDVEWLDIDIEEITANLQKALIDPINYISSCYWFPLQRQSGDRRVSLPYGWWTIPTSFRDIPENAIYQYNFNIDIPKHPLTTTRGNFLNAKPYTRHTLYVPGFGNFEVDATILANYESLLIVLRVDLITGFGFIQVNGVGTGANYQIMQIESQVGVPIELASLRNDKIGLVTSVAGTALDLVTLDFVGAANGIANAANSLIPKVNSIGSNGSIGIYNTVPRLVTEFVTPVDDSLEHRGRPLCKEKVINTIPGFIIVSDPDVSLPATLEENQRVKNYLSGGFYFE